MNLQELSSKIRHLDYVVQRNWEALPEMDEAHPDLDLFVSRVDWGEMVEICDPYEWIDVRSPGDGYYPPEIEDMLLRDRRDHKGFWVPSAKAYFLSLYWHANLHKERHSYHDTLRRAFFEWLPPIKAEDPGVGFYDYR